MCQDQFTKHMLVPTLSYRDDCQDQRRGNLEDDGVKVRSKKLDSA